jgi:hypothetical protein
MNFKYFLLACLFIFGLTIVEAQNKKIKITGTVTDINNKPIKGAIIFIDSVKTTISTNGHGFYKIKLDSIISEIAIFSSKHGLLSKKYKGEKKISFVFRENGSHLSEENLIINMGYKVNPNKIKESIYRGKGYEDFGSIFEILDKRFPFVKVKNGQIIIGNGPNSFNGDRTPLIFIDNIRSDLQALTVIPTNAIGEIKVIRRGSEAATYGSLGASNGVILVTQKK